jgi:hypothetical protein
LRKTVVAAVAALAAAGGATAAVAQTTTPAQLTVTVKPVKAGTKKKPRNSSIHLRVVNNDEKRTLQRLTITIPKTLELSGKGFKTCSESFLNSNGTSGCPKGSKVGRGSADAVVGVNGPTQTPLHFDVTAFVGGKNRINFYLHSTGTVKVDVVAPGRVAGRKLTVTVPQVAQEPVPNVWAGLVRLDTTLKGRAKKHLLIASAGCKGGKQRFSAVLTFADNGVSPAGTVPTSGSAKCSK